MATKSFRIRWCLTALILPALASLSCSKSSSNGSTTLTPDQFGQRYKFADNEISGWQQAAGTDRFLVCTSAELEDPSNPNPIDGAAPAYTDNGMTMVMFQYLAGPGSNACQVRAMDFGTDASATAMFAQEQKSTASDIAIAAFDTSTAIAYSVISGITVYAHFKASYFELYLTGFGTDQNAASQAATQFLQVLQAKTK